MNMKKFAAFALVLSALMIFSGISASAAAKPVVFNFSSQAKYDELAMYNLGTPYDCELSFDAEQKALKIVSANGPEDGGTGDPYVEMSTEDELGDVFSGDTYKWCKIKIKNESVATQFEFHFATDTRTIVAECCTHTPIEANSTEYKTYVFNVPEANLNTMAINNMQDTYTESLWYGDILTVRLDAMWQAEPSGQMPTGSTMYIAWMAFFDSEEAANAYTGPESGSTPAATTSAPAQTSAGTDAGTQNNTSSPNTASATDTAGATPAKNDNTTLYIILSCIAGVLLIGIIIVAIIGGKRKKKK